MSFLTSNLLTSGMRISLLACVLCICTVAHAGVRDDLRQARVLIEKGRLKSAQKLLAATVRRYPENRVAYLLLAKIYVKVGDVRTAAKYFRRAGSEVLDSASAYEFGMTMFSVKDFRNAAKGLQRVSSPQQKDIASFYLGVSQFRLRDYLSAELALRRARRLPDHLLASRRQLLLEIQKRRRNEQSRGYYARSYPYPAVQVPQPYAYPQSAQPVYGLPPGPGAPDQTQLTDDSAAKKAEPPKALRGFALDVTPRLEYLNETEETSKHATAERAASRSGPQGGADVVAHYFFDPDKRQRQAELNLAVTLSARSFEKSETNTTFVVDESAGGEPLLTSAETISSDRGYSWEIKPFASVPIGSTSEVEGGLKYGEDLPDMKPDEKSSYMGPFASFSFGAFEYNARLSAQMLSQEKLGAEGEIVNTDDQKVSVSVDGGDLPFDLVLNASADYTTTSNTDYGSIDGGFPSKTVVVGGLKKNWETFSIGGSVQKSVLDQPTTAPTTGTVDSTKLTGTATKTLKIGITLSVFGEYTLIDQYVKTGLCPSDASGSVTKCEDATQTAIASGDRIGYGGSLRFSPVEWAYASANYESRTSTYAVTDAALLPDFQTKVNDLVTSYRFLVGVTYGF